jgi:hypothetical protein
MRDIAALLFGSEPGTRGKPPEPPEPRKPRNPRDSREACLPGPPDTVDGPPLPAGDWCRTPPGRGTLEWLGFTRTRHAGRPGYARRLPR